MEKENLQWHPAFAAALRLTFQEEREELQILEEYSLSKSPPRIDALILKKSPHVKIKKKIGHIFRGYNIIEYKSPEDNLSINDFYKVYGYTCFYQSNTEKIGEITPTELTITFVCNHYPREMFRHLESVRGMKIHDQGEGVYYLTGDPIPIQFLYIPRLSEEENYWIQTLRNDLKAGKEIRTLMANYEKNRKSKDCAAVMNLVTRANWEQMEAEKKMCEALKAGKEIRTLMANYEKNRKSKDCAAVMNLVTRANWEQMEAEKKMCEALNELFAEELKEADLRGRKEGREEGKNVGKEEKLKEQVQKKLAQNQSIERIADDLVEDVEVIRMIVEELNGQKV